MTLDWIALAFSALAVFIAVLSYWMSKSSGSRQLRLEARRHGASLEHELRQTLSLYSETITKVRYGLARGGMGHFRIKAEDVSDLEEKRAEVAKLSSKLSEEMSGIEKKSDDKLEECLVQLQAIEDEKRSLVAWLQNHNHTAFK